MAKQKKSFFRWYYIIPIVLIVAVGIFVYVIFGDSSNNEPVYGRRCEEVETEITSDQIKAANTAIANIDGMVSGNVEVNCNTVNITITYNESVDLQTAETITDSITHLIDDALGFEKYNESDPYSKIFSNNELDRMYDIQIIAYSANDQFELFGYKHYQIEEVVYTSNVARDQSLVDNLYSSQGITTEENQ